FVAGNLYEHPASSFRYHPACFVIDRNVNFRIAAVRLSFSPELDKISPLEPAHFEISDHKGIIDGDAYARLYSTGIGRTNSDFGDPHGISLKPRMCPCRVDTKSGLARLKRRTGIGQFRPKPVSEILQRARKSTESRAGDLRASNKQCLRA